MVLQISKDSLARTDGSLLSCYVLLCVICVVFLLVQLLQSVLCQRLPSLGRALQI